MNFFNKIKWILGILMVFMLIITTNLIDKNNFLQIRDSVVTIYEDRLVAKNLISEFLKTIHQKELAARTQDTLFFTQKNDAVNLSIQGYIDQYEKTKFTSDENKIFQKFKGNIQALENEEDLYIQSEFNDTNQITDRLETLKINLEELSKIQIAEGKRQVSLSQRAANTVELFTRIEIYVLIVLAIIIQIIVMYSPKKDSD